MPIIVRPDLKLDADNVTTLCPKCHMIVENETQFNTKYKFN
ncbi:hypothetical protein [Lysinibacillus sphaericus]